jgi:hypothetical protein
MSANRRVRCGALVERIRSLIHGCDSEFSAAVAFESAGTDLGTDP